MEGNRLFLCAEKKNRSEKDLKRQQKKWIFGQSGGGIKASSSATFGSIVIIVLVVSVFEFEIFKKRIFPKYIPKLLEVLKREL